jgi:hypothetical protein
MVIFSRLPHACRGIVPPFWDDDGSRFRFRRTFHHLPSTFYRLPCAVCLMPCACLCIPPHLATRTLHPAPRYSSIPQPAHYAMRSALCHWLQNAFSDFRIPSSHFRIPTSAFRIFSRGIVLPYRTTTGPTSEFLISSPSPA